jgi:hypothetical protein
MALGLRSYCKWYITAIYAVRAVLGQEMQRETKWYGLCRRHSPLDVPNGRGCRRHRKVVPSGGAGGGASGPKDLGRRLGRRHNSRGVDAWQPLVVRWQLMGRRLGRRHNSRGRGRVAAAGHPMAVSGPTARRHSTFLT